MSFTYKGKTFLLNDQPFSLRSGAIHYFRIPKEYWYDRLLKLKECGFNCVETYVAWNLHEPTEGVFDFTGGLDIGKFLDTAKELGLYAIVRPGPYICAEWEAGGFPAWLLANDSVKLRCNAHVYLNKLEKYLRKTIEYIKPRLITNGGNVIMMQVENEYGSYGNDKTYLKRLVEIYRDAGADCLLFTCDGADLLQYFGGSIPEIPEFFNFGSREKENLRLLEKLRPGQPLVCSEFWCGWFDHWYDEHHTRNAEDVCKSIEEFLKNGYGFNFYMFAGGTNFGFMNGANYHLQKGGHCPTVTSYDYCAPLSECGDRTPVYYALRKLFEKYGINVPKLTAAESVKKAYGKVEFTHSVSLGDALPHIGSTVFSPTPLYMEETGQSYGYIMYSTEIDGGFPVCDLILKGLNDRAIVFVNGKKLGVYQDIRSKENLKIDGTDEEKIKLDILVENMGRVNYGERITDKKGLRAASLWGQHLFGWNITNLPMNNLHKLNFSHKAKPSNKPTFYKGEFYVDEPADTFIKPSGFEKGFILINGFNIGRYYNSAGPQKTLYIPAPLLKKGLNEVIVFDSDGTQSLDAELLDAPQLSEK